MLFTNKATDVTHLAELLLLMLLRSADQIESKQNFIMNIFSVD